MENTNTINVQGTGETLSPCIQAETVTISIDRFERLAKAERSLEIVRVIYETSETYSVKDRLALLFGPLPGKESQNA